MKTLALALIALFAGVFAGAFLYVRHPDCCPNKTDRDSVAYMSGYQDAINWTSGTVVSTAVTRPLPKSTMVQRWDGNPSDDRLPTPTPTPVVELCKWYYDFANATLYVPSPTPTPPTTVVHLAPGWSYVPSPTPRSGLVKSDLTETDLRPILTIPATSKAISFWIEYIDVTDTSNPKIERLKLPRGMTVITP